MRWIAVAFTGIGIASSLSAQEPAFDGFRLGTLRPPALAGAPCRPARRVGLWSLTQCSASDSVTVTFVGDTIVSVIFVAGESPDGTASSA